MSIIDKITDSVTSVAEKGIDKITSEKERLEGTKELISTLTEQDKVKIEAEEQIAKVDLQLMNSSKFPWWLSHNAIVRYVEIFCVVMIVYSLGITTIINDVVLFVHGQELVGAGDKIMDLFLTVGVYGSYNIARQTIKKKL